VTFNIFGVFIIAYLTGALQLPRQTALAGVMISSALMIAMLPIYGNLSDRIGRRRMFAYAGLLIGILSFPAFWLMETKIPILVWLAITVPFAFVYPAVYGPQAALFSELFDTRVRCTGASVSFQLAGIFGNAPAPLIATGLLALEGGTPSRSVLTSLFRDAHTLKGSARMMGLSGVVELAHDRDEVRDQVERQREVAGECLRADAVSAVPGDAQGLQFRGKSKAA